MVVGGTGGWSRCWLATTIRVIQVGRSFTKSLEISIEKGGEICGAGICAVVEVYVEGNQQVWVGPSRYAGKIPCNVPPPATC